MPYGQELFNPFGQTGSPLEQKFPSGDPLDEVLGMQFAVTQLFVENKLLQQVGVVPSLVQEAKLKSSGQFTSNPSGHCRYPFEQDGIPEEEMPDELLEELEDELLDPPEEDEELEDELELELLLDEDELLELDEELDDELLLELDEELDDELLPDELLLELDEEELEDDEGIHVPSFIS